MEHREKTESFKEIFRTFDSNMDAMDLQTRKINFIQDFLKLESEKAITHLENLLRKESKEDSHFSPMSLEEFNSRIEQSFEDSKNGRLTDANDLLSEIEKWS